MKKILLCILVFLGSYAMAGDTITKAENNEDLTPAGTYMKQGAYTQNPYVGMPSLGGTQIVSESAMVNQNFAEKLFADGTWNVLGEAAYLNSQYLSSVGYGANIFAQTGQLAGFSFGGFLTVMNPFSPGYSYFYNQKNPGVLLPASQQITPQELFVEYQYNDIVKVDAGYIGVNNIPWLTYYQNYILNLVTYQGGMINIHPGGGWMITALGFTDSQLIGENGFSQQTLYNSTFDYATGTARVVDNGSDGTIALGASYTNQGNDFGFRIWAYQFIEYANLLYADSNLKLSANKDLTFTIGAQAAMERGTTRNVFYDTGYGAVQSDMAGLQLSMKYDWLGLQLGYNNVWGPKDAFLGGGIASPYTYQYASDPLFTTSIVRGMVELSAGSAYKIAMPLSFINNNLMIVPSYAYYDTSPFPISAEYDLSMSYAIPQIKGFTVFLGGGYQSVFSNKQGNIYAGEAMFSYMY